MSRVAPGGDVDSDIRVEQMRLVLAGIKQSLYLGSALAVVLVLAFDSPQDRSPLLLWLGAVVSARVLCVSYASLALRRGVTVDNRRRLLIHMGLIKVLEGLVWGGLAWVVMGQGSLAAQLLAMTALAGISGNAASLLAPVLPLFLCMQLAQLASINGKLWMIGDESYRVLAISCTLFVAGLIGQAMIAQRASRSAIALRFENRDLVECLKIESERADQARLKAEEANLAKSKFLAAASHDLRQPIHAQELFLEVLERSDLSEVQRKVLGHARAASQASAQMLNTLLDFSRIEAGVIEPQRRGFQLQPLFNRLENELGGQADAKGIVYRCRETHLSVDSDPALLELILRNLITNAIRYTECGGLLVIARQRGEQVSIEVFDTGIGIEPAQQSEVFREFHQLGNPERDRLKGLGLGLAITEGLARSLDHGLSLVSRPGRGSVFRVRLPRVDPVWADDVFSLSDVPQRQPMHLGGLRVLVVEDDAFVREAMVQLLEDWGCECRAAEFIDEALQHVAHWPVQMLISDYCLRQNETGTQVIHQVREALGISVPALIITGDTTTQRLREARDSGVPLLHKPVSPMQLYRALADSVEAWPDPRLSTEDSVALSRWAHP
ncbi:Signal transduction histidine kinase [Pseudomonas sp. ok272]|uniref:ATP-binding response regulator n=1 Tax=unclassified Pseudomonas TaxID=196821 RepID=UPI0008D72DB1|nr:MULTISPECIES: hybrid sensor histidine kinase/response regulator [unclassified Pseudomonas]SEN11423.1 Signal transduction histidine kinase [Pseudomonas sp. ok272]SFN04503.1 Signal transduction histidine kinase [Pseudomonas sp. ok602]